MKTFPKIKLINFLMIILCGFASLSAYAESQDVYMQVGEVKTLYLPTSVTSKTLKSVTFYSNAISYVQVQSYTNFSVTVKAIKAFSAPIIVRCDYRYYINNGGYIYEGTGFYDFYVTVSGTSGDDSGVSPTRIYFPNSAAAVGVGESRQLEPIIEPANASYTLTWSINDTYVASVSSDGVLTGKNAGEADLTVKTNNGLYAMLRIVVSKPSATSVTVSPSTLELLEGDTRYLTSTVYPTTANQSVTWSSSNSNVASVSSIGKVTANKQGQCIITASTSNGKKANCSVTIIPKTILPTSITLPSQIEIISGESYFITPTILPENATYVLEWGSDDEDIATVSDSGQVTAISIGVTNIYANIKDTSLSSKCSVTVKDPSVSIDTINQSQDHFVVYNNSLMFMDEIDVVLIDLYGNIIYSGKAKQINNLKTGFYLIKINGRVQKIYIK